MLNADSKVCRFADVVSSANAAYWLSGRAFMRPIEDSKCFAGKVFEYDDVAEWVKKVVVLKEEDGSSMTGDTLVQVCSIKPIYAEYRFWVVKGEIITASMYKRGDKVYYSDEVDQCFHDYVKERIAEWQPLDAFVIDVCSIPGVNVVYPNQVNFNTFKIVEINTINSAGFYAADMGKLVDAFERNFNVD